MYIMTIFNIIMFLLLTFMCLAIVCIIGLIIETIKANKDINKVHSCKNHGAREWQEEEIFSIPYEKIGLE